jgi:hypothetical protein
MESGDGVREEAGVIVWICGCCRTGRLIPLSDSQPVKSRTRTSARKSRRREFPLTL